MRLWFGHPIELWQLFVADFVLRTLYQIGKTPLLPIFAAGLGAGEAMVGLIVAASTGTGIITKPLFGFLSDCWGRRRWLFGAIGVFVFVPFLYGLVGSPEQLFAIRQLHGLATAILGPVTLAYVIAMSSKNSAERVAVFGMARIGSYVVAPVLSAGLITLLGTAMVYPIIGALSLLAVIPVVGLTSSCSKSAQPKRNPRRLRELYRRACGALRDTIAIPTLWLAGGLEMVMYIATYAAKAFLPLHVMNQPNGSIALAGLFFTVQELVHLGTRPLGGRWAERYGYGAMVCSGCVVAGLGLIGLGWLDDMELLGVAVALGAGQGLAFPAVVAMLGRDVPIGRLGTGMGLYGALRNAGKVIGPVAIGILLEYFELILVFPILGVLLLCTGVLVPLLFRRRVVQRWVGST